MYVTHDQTEAMTMGDRVAVMRGGLIQQVDRPQRLYDRPTNLFVAEFIGSPKMNLVEAELVPRRDGVAARFGRHQLPLGARLLAERPAIAEHGRIDGHPGRPTRGPLGRRPPARTSRPGSTLDRRCSPT